MDQRTYSITQALRTALCGTVSLALFLGALVLLPHAADAQGQRYRVRIQNQSAHV
jgi:hypothetical protein